MKSYLGGFLLVSLCLGIHPAFCIEGDRDGVLEKIRAESVLKIKKFEFRDVNYANGIICVLDIEFENIESSGTHAGDKTVVLQPWASFRKYKEGLDPKSPDFKNYFNGWGRTSNAREEIRFSTYRKFKIDAAEVLLQVPDNMSYLEVSAVLTFLKQNGVDISKSRGIEKKDSTINFRTLEEYKNPLNAKGEFFKIKLDEKGNPVEILSKGRWYA